MVIRPQYSRMMDLLKQGGADTVVIYDQSRMFRKMTAWFGFRDELENLGVKVVSVTQPIIGGDLTDPSNFLMEGSMALFNQMWVLQTRQKVVEKMRFMARECRHTGGIPPFGYKVVDGKLAVEESEAEIVRRIFSLIDNGSSYRDVIRVLNDEGIKTKRGCTFGTNSLHDLLKNKKYVGIYTYGKTAQNPNGTRNSHKASKNLIEIPGGCPAIIDAEMFDRVQEKLTSRKHTGGPKPKREFSLHGKVFCGECQSPMHIRYSGGNSKYAYYVCDAQKRTHICGSVPIRADRLESDIAAAIKEKLGKPKNLEKLIFILREQRDSIQGEACGKLSGLIERKKEIVTQLENASNAVLMGLTSQTLINKITVLENQKSVIEYQISQLKSEVSKTDLTDSDIEKTLAAIVQAVDSEDSAVLSIVYRVEVYENEIRVWTIIDEDPDRHKSKRIPAETLPSPGGISIVHNCFVPLGSTKKKTTPLGWFSF